MTVRDPHRELREYVELLRRRQAGGLPVAPAHMAMLRERWEVLDRAHRWDVEHRVFGGSSPPADWELLEAEFAAPTSEVEQADLNGEDAKRGAKEKGIPKRELFWILERRLENGDKASGRWLEAETARRADLTRIPRDRLAPFVDWINTHPERARTMLDRREIPLEFRATRDGWAPPKV